MTGTPLLTATDLRVSYGAFHVIKGVSLSVNAGDALAIIGPNGAGKSTLFKALTGEISCRSGEVRFRGKDVTALPAHLRTAEGMGRTFQVSRVFLELTALANVIVALESRQRCKKRGQGRWWRAAPEPALVEEAGHLLSQLGIAHLRHEVAATISHGDRKRLELALALALDPLILMLDEPTAGMAPADRMHIVDLILSIRAEKGVAVIMTEHDMDVIFSISEQVMVLNYGEVIAAGTVDEVRNSQTVREVYLGKDMYHAEG
ncbi:ATP-binding cassette domain-containing protein [Rhodobacter sphaeroides]|jgi:amino acid/amide ABC transporter ATP-binding protein 1, HAAT family (TC 3.A.1.4.-)|uniref:Amino acid/amide ABC transporter ATP-binding protein 1, HAAT family n=2 Tax=Cereibacter sphaeroides TaxID=1063 RepID=Q3IVD4_CERS4|nr:ABC transporter ATP-binding protein [Cereibacter sphaeroides]ABA81500.1 amino acid/amide ABC transporter ATP-binding protein 1, HAAT family [Cereibacter sphaeroides 2.4.1]AMJ50053.1 ABC transporter ATP-binding protein [Cereibacter sphaeroides]ANS36865.1 ABC transporter ATP-binding protein [Cereibacter sphaeroides]AXC63890.1 ABC transporter ATP-binding protein [Cereibacter sphaeroides 2.4.1]AZB57800.1 ABC transporter ATP-binding protein [Cereibacter sphaeroides]